MIGFAFFFFYCESEAKEKFFNLHREAIPVGDQLLSFTTLINLLILI